MFGLIKYFQKYRVDSCGSTIAQNITYIQNLAYPSSITSASTSCAYTISGSEDICQIRLDFVSVVTGSASAGTCSDSITATSPTNSNNDALPTLCGTLTGSHSKCLHFDIFFKSWFVFQRIWLKIWKISQILELICEYSNFFCSVCWNW